MRKTTTPLWPTITPTYVGGRSLRSRALSTTVRATCRPLFGAWAALPFDFFPPNVVEHLARRMPLPAGSVAQELDMGEFDADWVVGDGVLDAVEDNDRAILYLHGGAFLLCGLATHRRLVARISTAADQPALSIGYRHWPRAPINTAVDDGLAGFAALVARGYEPENITIAGDSAGGYLAFAIARAVIDAGWGTPAGVVALSPLLQRDSGDRRVHRNARRDQLFPASALNRFTGVAERMDRRHGITDPVLCPVDMRLDDLPPVFIQLGSREILMSDAELMAGRLARAGVPVEIEVWQRQVHVFQAAASWLPEAQAAVRRVGDFIGALAVSETRVPESEGA